MTMDPLIATGVAFTAIALGLFVFGYCAIVGVSAAWRAGAKLARRWAFGRDHRRPKQQEATAPSARRPSLNTAEFRAGTLRTRDPNGTSNVAGESKRGNHG